MTDPAGGSSPEFSRIVRADRVPGGGLIETIQATDAERRAVAERLELEAVHRLTATLRLTPVRGGTMIRVVGEIDADVVQTCVVSLEAVPGRVSDRFGALFAPPDLVPDEEEEMAMLMDPDVAEEDIPEAMIDGRIDIGELATQHLSLALDPYPRAPGAAFEGFVEDPAEGEVAEAERPNPFAELAKLKGPN